VDYFLQSLAADQGGRAIGVILSGTASDGVKGMKDIKEVGGITFAQDEATAKYTGMPQSAVAAGCADFVLPPDRIAQELARLARHPSRPALAQVPNLSRRQFQFWPCSRSKPA
jgi:two-component system CheB/CheR fusion protein